MFVAHYYTRMLCTCNYTYAYCTYSACVLLANVHSAYNCYIHVKFPYYKCTLFRLRTHVQYMHIAYVLKYPQVHNVNDALHF